MQALCVDLLFICKRGEASTSIACASLALQTSFHCRLYKEQKNRSNLYNCKALRLLQTEGLPKRSCECHIKTYMYTPQSIKRDKQKRTWLSKRVIPQLVHKAVCHDRSQDSLILSGWNMYKKHARKLHHSSENAVQTRIRNRCVISGRARGVYRFCKLSRVRIRELAGKGLLVGVTKASW